MRALWIPWVACCSLALSGCHAVYSAHPLHTSEDAVEEPALVGEWKSSSNDGDRFCIQKGEDNTYTMIVSDSENESKSDGDAKPEKALTIMQKYQITLVQLDNQLFADMVPSGQLVGGREVDPPVGAVYHHILIKLELADPDLGYFLLDSSTVREANAQGYAPLGYMEIDDGILLTASTEELRWAVSHYADRLFRNSEEHYVRATGNEADGTPSPCSAIPST